MSFLQIMLTAQAQQLPAIESAYREGRAYTLISITESLVMGRNVDGQMVYNGRVI